MELYNNSLMGDNTRNTYKDNYNRNVQYELTSQISKQIEENNIEINNTIQYNKEREIICRELGSRLYTIILQKYNLNKEDLTQHQLDELLLKYNIGNENQQLNSFVNELKQIIKQNINTSQNIHESMYQINNNDNSIDIKNEYLVSIDSNDRNIVKWKNANEYQILFGRIPTILGNNDNMNSLGNVKRNFNNISSVEIIDIVLKGCHSITTINMIPYLLLEIDELGSNISGTNNNISKSIAKLTHYKEMNEYRYYLLNIKKKFNPPIDINFLTFKFKKPDGELIDLEENSITLKFII